MLISSIFKGSLVWCLGERTEASREIEEAKEEIFSQRQFSKSKAQSLNFYFKFLFLRERQEAHFLICLSRMSPFSQPHPWEWTLSCPNMCAELIWALIVSFTATQLGDPHLTSLIVYSRQFICCQAKRWLREGKTTMTTTKSKKEQNQSNYLTFWRGNLVTVILLLKIIFLDPTLNFF